MTFPSDGCILRYDELKQFIRSLPRHDVEQEVVSVQTALNRRLMPSNAYDDVVRLICKSNRGSLWSPNISLAPIASPLSLSDPAHPR